MRVAEEFNRIQDRGRRPNTKAALQQQGDMVRSNRVLAATSNYVVNLNFIGFSTLFVFHLLVCFDS